MATFTASAAQSFVTALAHHEGTITRTISHSNSASYTAADVVLMCKVPNGAVIHDIQLSSSLSAGVVVVNLGDSTNASAYAADLALSGAGVQAVQMVPFNKIGYSYSAEDIIKLTVVSTSTPAANAKLRLQIVYSLQN